MPLRSTTRPSLTEQVIAQLEELIGSGEWPIGQRIPPEPQLVTQLVVGRNTVREAVRALVHAGLLETRQGDGTYVRATSDLHAALGRRLARTSMLEALEVRASLERDAARLAAERRTGDDLRTIEEAWARRNRLRETDDRDGFVDADIDLHLAIAAAAHNTLLLELYEQLTETMRESLRTSEPPGPERTDSAGAHADLVEAVRRGSPADAERAVTRLLVAAREQVERFAETDREASA